MKIKRFVDTDMRRVLRRVRQDQGDDAVILSNRRVEEGIEVIAAVDYDEALVQQALGSPVSASQTASAGTEDVVADVSKVTDVAEVTETSKAANKPDIRIVSADLRPTTAGANPQDAAIKSLQGEITDMRGMLETQLSSLVWSDTTRKLPMQAQILRNLTKIGVGPDIANLILDRLPPMKDAKQLWRAPLIELAKTVPLVDDDLLRNGGVAALVGPTGVGKTTTIAKMASQYALRFGASEIALISADAHRIGAQEQLATFANILGIKVHAAEDVASLEELLHRLRDKKLVLIDTEGTSQRDINLTARLAAYGRNEDRVKFYLTLAATCQEAGIDETLRIFNRLPLSGAVITKIDEAAQLGCVLGALIRHDLPAAFLSDGQRVPDDLHPAAKKRLWLINQAVECMRSSEIRIDEHMMVERFGTARTAHA